MTPWTVASLDSSVHGISRQEYWSVLPCPTPGALNDPGIKPRSPAFAGRFFFFLTTETLGKPYAFWSSYLGEGVSMPQEDIFLVISMALQVIDIFSLVNSDFHLMDKASL